MNARWKDEFYGPPTPLPAWFIASLAFAGLFVISKLLELSF